ncbi:uncharacterized protein VTP21DRAFT_11349 [Calcarisporiella thermophila]|uniref:uncharacterized protein n=1 Tax=Calcarisporiella thermophila TaxID=911321 RepID=UPI003744019D
MHLNADPRQKEALQPLLTPPSSASLPPLAGADPQPDANGDEQRRRKKKTPAAPSSLPPRPA